MTWFETLTGFSETPDNLRSSIQLDGTKLSSQANGRTFDAGRFTTPSLCHLRENADLKIASEPNIKVSEVVADVQALHQNPSNENAVFQVASQFNCLEMAAPHMVPEDGVGVYQNDRTQGPACCICAGAGTIFRNYFVELNGRTGQSSDNQIDCLSSIGGHFKNATNNYWRMKNGYCFPTPAGLGEVERQLSNCDESELNDIRGLLMAGVQSNTEVTIGSSNHKVTQVFCSALPVAYSDIPSKHWDHFPRLILDATYELTFYIALKNLAETGCAKLYLTLVGGGVFGNKMNWISSSIQRSLGLFAYTGLDVRIVSYGSSQATVAQLVRQHNSQ